jgi:hypothetical protein
MQAMIKRIAVVVTLLLVFLWVGFVAPLPPHRPVREDVSPDKTQLARYTWKPAGLFGQITEDNPWVYLTLVELSSGKTTASFQAWGDTPDDAISRFKDKVPWRK